MGGRPEMTGWLGNVSHFGSYGPGSSRYLGTGLVCALSRHWTFCLQPESGLSAVANPFFIRTGVTCTINNFFHMVSLRFINIAV